MNDTAAFLGRALVWALAAAGLPAQSPAGALRGKLDELCRPLVEAGLAHGFVVGVLDGETSLVRGYGRIAPGCDRAPDGGTIYEIGSCTKVFTGVLLADAVGRGLLALEDPVQNFLPEGVALSAWNGSPVRLWHLATHTSGLPRLPDMRGADPADPYAHFDAGRLHAALQTARVRWEPGSKYEYSNLAVGVLGQVLAAHQGCASYAALLHERIARPLGLKDTLVALDAARLPRLAPPHDADGEPAHAWNLAALAGAGGIRSTVNDLLEFARAHWAAEGPLAGALRMALEKRHAGAGGIALGLGWHIARDGSTRLHSGQTGGYHAFLALAPSTRRAVCILANTARGEFDALGERLIRLLHGLAVKPLEIELPVAVERALLARLAGRYLMSPGVEFAVALGERGLTARLTGQPALRLYPRSPTEFFYRAVTASIAFELEGDAVKALVLRQDGRVFRCARIAGAEAR